LLSLLEEKCIILGAIERFGIQAVLIKIVLLELLGSA
jgi:hypothetical protein